MQKDTLCSAISQFFGQSTQMNATSTPNSRSESTHGDPVQEALAQSLSPSNRDRPFDAIMGEFLSAVIVLHKWELYVNDKPMEAELLTNSRMMLPTIYWQAEKTHQLLIGKSMGVQFRADETAAVGAVAVVQTPAGSSKASHLLFGLDVVCQALENFTLEVPGSNIDAYEVRENTLRGKKLPPVGTAGSIDHLIQGFFQDHELGMVPWTADSNPRHPNVVPS